MTFSLTPAARTLLDLDAAGDIEGDEQARLALPRRLYRAFDRLTSLADPACADRRRRLPHPQAAQLAAAWEDDDPEHRHRRNLLQTITTALVLAPLRRAATRGHLRHWNGDVGIDTTSLACWTRPPRRAKQLPRSRSPQRLDPRPGRIGQLMTTHHAHHQATASRSRSTEQAPGKFHSVAFRDETR